MNEPLDEEEDMVHPGPSAIAEAGIFGRGVVGAGLLFAAAIVVSALILFYEVIMRYVFNSPTTWAHETVVFLNACAFVFGGLYAAALNTHIRVVLFYDALSPGVRRVFDMAISLTCAVASGFFAFAAWQSVKRAVWTPAGEFRLESSGSAWDPVYPGLLKVFLLVVLVALAIQFLILAAGYARGRHAR
ncbi:TRAP transporter small permease subunit [Rhodobacter sp. NSM]|uniref:TRAP transporter small permease subunit n=1 Tax=Rhodobacter sp. NSM TaxID=3457501 RepID=UPI003FD3745A